MWRVTITIILDAANIGNCSFIGSELTIIIDTAGVDILDGDIFADWTNIKNCHLRGDH